MKKAGWKKVMALLLAAMMALSMFGGVALAEEGEEEPAYQFTNSYIINLAGYDLGDYPAPETQMYVSPHLGSMRYAKIHGDDQNEHLWTTYQDMYNLINTDKLVNTPAEERVGAYASIAAYCTDANVSARRGYSYERTNLEDCTYYPEGIAGVIRNIFMSSFPMVTDMEALAAKANAWLAATSDEYVAIQNLTGAEALSATQLAIWELATGDQTKVTDPYNITTVFSIEKMEGYSYHKGLSEENIVDCYESKGEHTANNIRMLFQYLINLPEMAPQDTVVASSSFEATNLGVAYNAAENNYDITVEAVVDVKMEEGDELVLTAFFGEASKSVRLENGKNTFVHTFADVETPGDVKLEINGYQAGGDVYLFDAEGDRAAAQSMVAYDDSRLPVHAETIVTPNRVINIHKVTQDDGRTYPLEGIVFDIYYICTVDEYTADLGTYADPSTLKDGRTPLVTLTTDATGRASVDLTAVCREAGRVTADGVVLADGVYLVVERDHVAIKKPMDPVLIAVPMTMQDGSGLSYTVNMQPKNEVKPGPGISKDVTSIGNDSDSFNIGEEHTWIIRGNVPVDVAEGKSYVIRDILDYRLTYAGDSKVVVRVESLDGAESITLNKFEHYSLYSGSEIQDVQVSVDETREERVDSFRVELTEAGMDAVAAAIAEGKTHSDYEVRVYANAMIDEDAGMGEWIENKATLEYKNSVGFQFEVESDKPYVYTCGIEIYKHSVKETAEARMPLADARFKLARLATEQEKAEGLAASLVIGNETQYVMYESFYLDEACTVWGNCIITNADGQGLAYGLKDGTYYLVEVKAPAGYNLLSRPVEVVLNQNSAATPVRVANSNAFRLPDTGGIGTVIFTVGGGLLIAAAAVLLIVNKKKDKEDDEE